MSTLEIDGSVKSKSDFTVWGPSDNSATGGGISTGNADGGTLDNCNIDIKTWYGVGIMNVCGGAKDRTIAFDARGGNITAKGSITANGNLSVNNKFFFTSTGLGVNSSNPYFPIQISGSGYSDYSQSHWKQNDGRTKDLPEGNWDGTGPYNFGLRVESASLFNHIFIVSDQRIKKNIKEPSINIRNTINKIDIVSYDEIQNGNHIPCGVIAQQVEEVYPNAVKHATDYIPNVMKYVKITEVMDDFLIIKSDSNIDIVIGDKIKLVSKTNQNIYADVLDSQENIYKINKTENESLIGDEIFLVGKLVNDFRSVDKESLALLALGGVKELIQENESLKDRLYTQEQINQQLQLQLDQQKSEIETMKAQIMQLMSKI